MVATLLVTGVLLPIAGQFSIELAREYGVYDHLTQRLDTIIRAVRVVQPWLLVATAFFVGLALNTWSDLLFRRRPDEPEQEHHGRPADVSSDEDRSRLDELRYFYRRYFEPVQEAIERKLNPLLIRLPREADDMGVNYADYLHGTNIMMIVNVKAQIRCRFLAQSNR